MLALALVLALQVVFSALGLGHAADRPQLDAFGHVLCLSGAGTDPGGQEPHDKGQLPACCTLACSMLWAPLPARDGDGIAPPSPVAAAVPRPAPTPTISSSFLDHRRRHPRGPPAAA